MIEVISHPITLLCLGVIFVLCALLFFYFKRSMMVIEQAQMEQATVLRNFIASMEMRKHEFSQPSAGFAGSMNVQKSNQDDILIDVSDNEMKSHVDKYASSDDNAYETESDSDSEYSTTSEEHDNDTTIKVINVEDLEDLNKTYSAYSHEDSHNDCIEEIPDIDESVSTSCDDMFSTDLDKMESEKDNEEGGNISEIDMNSLMKTSFIHHSKETSSNSLSLSTNGNIEQFDQMSILLSHEDFKGYTVSQIREYALHRGIISKGDKMKKKELVDYVIEANIEGGAEHLKVNKVGSGSDTVTSDEVSTSIEGAEENNSNTSSSIAMETEIEATEIETTEIETTEIETDYLSNVIKSDVVTEVEQYEN